MSSSHGQQTFNTGGSQTWVVPFGVTKIRFECWGRGGNGGSSALGEGGGSGGPYARRNASTVIPRETLTLVVANSTNVFSSVTNAAATLLGRAGPGTNGTGQAGGVASQATSQGDVLFIGGSGGAGDATGGGGGGSSGGPAAAGVVGAAASGTGGAGGTPPAGGGAGGNGGNTGANGSNGTQPGGGGGGGGDAATAGTGADGRIVITW